MSRYRIYLAYHARLTLDAQHSPEGERRYHAQLLREYHAYYAAVKCEEESTWSALRTEDRLKRLHEERHRR
eukprot:2893699-Prymnesium_polylepis.1